MDTKYFERLRASGSVYNPEKEDDRRVLRAMAAPPLGLRLIAPTDLRQDPEETWNQLETLSEALGNEYRIITVRPGNPPPRLLPRFRDIPPVDNNVFKPNPQAGKPVMPEGSSPSRVFSILAPLPGFEDSRQMQLIIRAQKKYGHPVRMLHPVWVANKL